MSVQLWLSRHLQRLWRMTEQKTFRRSFVIVGSIILLIVGLPVIIGLIAQLSYQSKNYEVAQRWWRAQSIVAWYDKDVPLANAGLAYSQLDNLTPSIDRLEQALALAHPSRECRVRWNLAVVLDRRADQRKQGQPNDAVGDYARAINILSEERCLNDPEYHDKFQQLIDTLTNKMELLIMQINEQHQRPEETEDQQAEENTTVPDEEKNQQQAKRQNTYQNNLNEDRYDQQSEEEKNKKYTESVW